VSRLAVETPTYLIVAHQGRASLPGRGGYQISTDLGRAYRHGCHAQIFFLRDGVLIYFLEIKEFKARATNFLNPFNGRAAVHGVIGLFIFQVTKGRPSAVPKNAAKFGVGGIDMQAHHDG
jgi:hypothetical protein